MDDALEAMMFCLVALLAVGIVTSLAALVMVFYGWGPGAGTARKVTGGAAIYMIVVGALGAWSYAVVPAQYTRDLQPSWPPVTRSLAAQHADAEAQLMEGYLDPIAAAQLRDSVSAERAGFVLGWLVFSLAAGAGALGAVKLAGRSPGARPVASTPARARPRATTTWTSAPARARRTAA